MTNIDAMYADLIALERWYERHQEQAIINWAGSPCAGSYLRELNEERMWWDFVIRDYWSQK